VVNQQEKMIKELEEKKVMEGQDVDEAEFTWVIEQSLEKLQLKYCKYMIILYMLCQLPGGALDDDLDSICSEMYPKWKEFIWASIDNSE
jgi:hypothetical protein